MNGFLKKYRGLIILLFILTFLTPLAFLVAEHFNFGDAWGEWESEALQKIVGFVPEGMKRQEGLREKSPMPDYSIPGMESFGALGYFISAIAGIIIIFVIFFLFYKLSLRKKN